VRPEGSVEDLCLMRGVVTPGSAGVAVVATQA
jgi:hypothetical protein